jgi:hypothetical protein
MMIPDSAENGAMLEEATRELEAAIHDARVAFDCIGLGEIERAHTSAVTARVAIDAAVTAVQAALGQTAGGAVPGVPYLVESRGEPTYRPGALDNDNG